MRSKESDCFSMADSLMSALICPDCRGTIHVGGGKLTCISCQRVFRIDHEIPVLLPKEIEGDLTDSIQHFQDSWKKTFFPPYDVSFAIYDETIWGKSVSVVRDVVEEGQSQGHLVADFGSGGGTLLWNLAKVMPRRVLVGIDNSFEACCQAKHLLDVPAVLNADISKIPLRDHSVDMGFSTMTIEHCEEHRFLEEIRRCLKPDGYLLVSSVLREDGARYFYKNKSGVAVLEPTHVKEYTSCEEFLQLLEQHSLRPIFSRVSKIKFPALDPLFKLLYRVCPVSYTGRLPNTNCGAFLRKRLRIPIPGFSAIEVIAQKKDGVRVRQAAQEDGDCTNT